MKRIWDVEYVGPVLADQNVMADFGPHNVSWQVYVGCIAATIPFVIGATEFVKRIVRTHILEG